jgi:LmbE family N-acetylglucosaminyl deacetylase
VLARLERLKPHAVVTYPVHGISGFHDHLVTHAVVKRAFEESSPRISNLQRLAFYTITQDQAKEGYFSLSGSTDEEIDCIHEVEQEDVENGIRALDCYVTFQETIEKTGIKKHIGRKACFEFYRQTCDPPVPDLVFGLT